MIDERMMPQIGPKMMVGARRRRTATDSVGQEAGREGLEPASAFLNLHPHSQKKLGLSNSHQPVPLIGEGCMLLVGAPAASAGSCATTVPPHTRGASLTRRP